MLGSTTWTNSTMTAQRSSISGGVFTGSIRVAARMKTVEWMVTCAQDNLIFPPTAPSVGHTVIVRTQY